MKVLKARRGFLAAGKRFSNGNATSAWKEQLWGVQPKSMVGDEHAEPRDMVTLRVPATSANMGPGFDSLGMALDIWNEIKVERADEFSMTTIGEGADDLPTDKSNLVVKGLEESFRQAGLAVPPLKYTCTCNVPYARGMGSSSAAIVGGLLAGLIISGHRFKCWGHEEFLNFASQIEGHADNVAPAIYGGIQIGVGRKERWYSSRVQYPAGLQCILFVPNFISETSAGRAILPDKWTKDEVTHNIQRAALLVNGFNRNDWNDIGIGTEDMLHQPYRAPRFKHMQPVITAAKRTGAIGAYLSGSGPTILAMTGGGSGDIFSQRDTERNERAVADNMMLAASRVEIPGRVFITQPSSIGAHVIAADPPMSETGLVRIQGAQSRI